MKRFLLSSVIVLMLAATANAQAGVTYPSGPDDPAFQSTTGDELRIGTETVKTTWPFLTYWGARANCDELTEAKAAEKKNGLLPNQTWGGSAVSESRWWWWQALPGTGPVFFGCEDDLVWWYYAPPSGGQGGGSPGT